MSPLDRRDFLTRSLTTLGAAGAGAAVGVRLSSEPMVDYVTPVGGGYFFVPPGSRGPNDWVGSALA